MDRRDFLRTMGTAAAGILGSLPVSKALARVGGMTDKKPNIIFILADDLGYGDIGCYGQKQIQTPVIDGLAAEGIRFTDCYSGTTVCAPSRCALMTGLHTGHCYIRGNDRIPLRPEDRTVAEVLKGAGYRTGLVGKWGLGNEGTTGTPDKHGFDYSFGYLDQKHAHDYHTDHLFRNGQEVKIPAGTYSHDLFAQEALDFVRREHDKPFFLYLAYTIPHANNELGKEGMEVPDDGPYKDKDWPEQDKHFAAMITRMDSDIGDLMKLLKELEIDDNTLVFFTSDNGPHKEGGHNPEYFNSRGGFRGIKRDMYDGGIRVPMVARWPGKIKPGQVSKQVWAFWDFLPTCAEIAGVESPKGLDGISMLPALTGCALKDHEYLYWEFHEKRFGQAVRMGKWKAVRNDVGKPIELYDIESDLGEEHDVAAEHPDIVKKIDQIMRDGRTDSEHWVVKPKP